MSNGQIDTMQMNSPKSLSPPYNSHLVKTCHVPQILTVGCLGVYMYALGLHTLHHYTLPDTITHLKVK